MKKHMSMKNIKVHFVKVMLLVAVLLVCAGAATITPKAAAVTSYTESGVTYKYGSGTLTITGNGTVTSGWQSKLMDSNGNLYKYNVKKVVFNGDGLTYCNYNAFSGCSSLATVTVTKYNDGNFNTSVFSDNSYIETVSLSSYITSMESYAFDGCSNLSKVTFSSKLTSIPSYAFRDTALTSVTIPASVKSIDNYAFYRCSSLTTVDTGSGVTSIGSYAFSGCASLKTLTIGSGVTTIGSSAFSNCTALVTASTGNGVTRIESSAFSGCSGLTTLTIGENVDYISSSAFSGCPLSTKLTINAIDLTSHNNVFRYHDTIKTIALGTKVTQIPSYLFQGCEGIKSITIPAKCESVGDYAFDGCTKLGTLSFSSTATCTSVGSYAFRGTNLWTVAIPNSVTTIGSYAFSGCKELDTLTIGTGVTTIGSGAFMECPLEMSLTFNAANLTTHNSNFSGKNIPKLTMGSGVTQIPGNIFSGCTRITTVTIPAKCTSIGRSAFYGCSSLTTVTFSGTSTCTSIGNTAFYNCKALNKIVDSSTSNRLPNSVKTIGDSAFAYTDLVTLQMGTSETTGVSSIGSLAFNGCSNLENLKIYNSSCNIQDIGITDAVIWGYMPSKAYDYTQLHNEPFIDIKTGKATGTSGNITWTLTPSTHTLALTGTGSMNSYSFASAPWSKYKILIHKVTIAKNITSVGNSAFNGLYRLDTATVPDTVTSIGDWAFYDTALTTLQLGSGKDKGATSIGTYAFDNCKALGSIKFYNTSCTISSYNSIPTHTVIYGYTGSKAESYAGSNGRAFISLDEAAISWTSGDITCKLTLSTGAFNISGTGAMVNYSKGGAPWYKYRLLIKTVTVGNKITAIGNHTFEDCSLLSNVAFTATSTCEIIGDYAFNNCKSLKKINGKEVVNFPESINKFGNYSFYNTGFLDTASTTGKVIRLHTIAGGSTKDTDGDGKSDVVLKDDYYDNLKIGYNAFGMNLSSMKRIVTGQSGAYRTYDKNTYFKPISYNYPSFDRGWLQNKNAPGVVKACDYQVTYLGEIDANGDYVNYDMKNIENPWTNSAPMSCIFTSMPIHLEKDWSIDYTVNISRCNGAEGAVAVYLVDEAGNMLKSSYRRSLCKYRYGDAGSDSEGKGIAT